MFDCVYSTRNSLPLYKKHNDDDAHQNCVLCYHPNIFRDSCVFLREFLCQVLELAEIS